MVGPLLTEREFERRVGAPAGSLRGQPYLLRIAGVLSLEPAYPAFQLEGDVVRPEIAWLVMRLRHHMDDLDACDWFFRPCPDLLGMTPLQWLDRDQGVEAAGRAIAAVPAPLQPRTTAAPHPLPQAA